MQTLPLRHSMTEPRVSPHVREGKFRRLLNHSPFSIHEINREGLLISMNPAGLRMMGVKDQADIRDVPYLSTVSDEDRTRVAALLRQTLDGALAEFEYVATNDRHFESTLVPMFDKSGQVERLMGLALDVTDNRLTELSLERLREALAEPAAEDEEAPVSDARPLAVG